MTSHITRLFLYAISQRHQRLNQFGNVVNSPFQLLQAVRLLLEITAIQLTGKYRDDRVMASSSSTTSVDQDQNHLHQELIIEEESIRQKDTQLTEQDAELKQLHTLLQEKDVQFKQKDAELRQEDEESGLQYALLLREHKPLPQKRDQLCYEQHQLQRESSRSLSAKPVSCSHLFVSFSTIKPYIITHCPYLSVNALSYIVPPILPQSL